MPEWKTLEEAKLSIDVKEVLKEALITKRLITKITRFIQNNNGD